MLGENGHHSMLHLHNGTYRRSLNNCSIPRNRYNTKQSLQQNTPLSPAFFVQQSLPVVAFLVLARIVSFGFFCCTPHVTGIWQVHGFSLHHPTTVPFLGLKRDQRRIRSNSWVSDSILFNERSKPQRKQQELHSKYHDTLRNSKHDIQRYCTKLSVSKTEEDLFFLSTKGTDSSTSTNPPNVQRFYETFRWRYKAGTDIKTLIQKYKDGNIAVNENNDYQSNEKKDENVPYFNINYRVEGPIDGKPILLVHGFGVNVNHFRYQFPALTQSNFRVYAIDLIGFGASDKPTSKPTLDTNNGSEPFGYCIELFVQLILDFIEHINTTNSTVTQQEPTQKGLQPWVIAGNSIGGLCSLCVAAARPDLIRNVVLFNCAGGMTGFRYDELPWYLRPVLSFVQNVMLGPIYGPKFFANFKSRSNVESILVQQKVYGDPTNVNDELMELILAPADDGGAEKVFLQVFGGPPGPTPESVLPHVQCPILAIWGSKDPWTPVDAGLHPGIHFGKYNSKFELVILDNVGHCPHDENPTAVHTAMIPWLLQN